MKSLAVLALLTLSACSSTSFSIARADEEDTLSSIIQSDGDIDVEDANADASMDAALDTAPTASDSEVDNGDTSDAPNASEASPDAPDLPDTRTTHLFPALVAGVLPSLACAGNTSTTVVARSLPVRRIELLIKWWYKYSCPTEHSASISINGQHLTTVKIAPALNGQTTDSLIDMNVNIVPVDGKYTIVVKLNEHVDRECSSSGNTFCGDSTGGSIRIWDGCSLVLE